MEKEITNRENIESSLRECRLCKSYKSTSQKCAKKVEKEERKIKENILRTVEW